MIGLKPLRAAAALTLPLVIALGAYAQPQRQEERPLVCKQSALSALVPIPRLEYECRPEAANDSDETILKWPQRVRAVNAYAKALERLNGEDWWRAGVDDLNICDFRKSAGPLSAEQRRSFEGGEYGLSLFGNNRIRLVLVADPCYQTGYSGSNAFLLYRRNGRVHATEVIDGYFSRADNSVGIDFALSSTAGQVIEIETSTGGLNPYVTNYYFRIDERSGRAVPLKLFRERGKLMNQITTAMIMSELKDLGLSRGDGAMEVIKGNRLARSFNVYEDDAEGKIDDNGRSLRRRVYRWNGRFYVGGR